MKEKRLFVTTSLPKIETMYSQDSYENEMDYVNANLQSFPKEFEGNNGCKIILLEDTFSDWKSYSLEKQTDYILVHASSLANVKSIIEDFVSSGIKAIYSSHGLGKPHDMVYRFLLSENKNFDDLIDELFPSVIITSYDGSELIIYKEEARKAYRQLYKSLTLAYIKRKNESNHSEEKVVIENVLTELNKFFQNDFEIQIPKEGSLDKLYEYLKSNHSVIEEKLFD